MITIMLRIVWFVGTTWLYLSVCTALTCHCLNNATCDLLDGSCTVGCEKGWYGPGCQLGNLAFNKPAFQSSTFDGYNASNAVDGYFPSLNDASARSCSHTMATNNGPLWWYVVLSDSEDFVLKNITVVNIQGPENEQNLRNFYILYTRSVTTPPDPTTWERCTFQKTYQSTTVATYTCANYTAIGRQVAVYLVSGSIQGSQDKLTLCEVYVDGYAYTEASMFKEISTNVTIDCENILISFSKLPIVPPTYLVVQLRDNNRPNVMHLERIRNVGNRSIAVRSTVNGTYSLTVAPETCCIGSQCSDSFFFNNSQCIAGESTMPVNVTIAPVTEYGLKKMGFVISIVSLNEYACSSKNINVKCSQSSNDKISTVNCSNDGSCELDPRYNYTCILEASFSSGYKQTLKENIHFSTADFSSFVVSEAITCNSITLLIKNVTQLWDLEPSVIEFYLSPSGGNTTETTRVSLNVARHSSATFSVISNCSYYAWAVPLTFWSRTESLDIINGRCNDSKICVSGTATEKKVITSLQRQYIFNIRGCCVSFQDRSPNQCKAEVTNKIYCTVYENSSYGLLPGKNASVCGLKHNVNYICSVDTYINNVKVDSYSHKIIIENTTECPPPEETEANDQTYETIGGAIACITVIITATLVAAGLLWRRRSRNKTSADTEESNVAYINLGAMEDAIYGNTVGMDNEAFEHYIQNETAICHRFSELGSNEGHSCSIGLGNTLKNRYTDIVPYDFNRVIVHDESCNYVNASYINGFTKGKKYIATQGPILATIVDFWKMVWQENVEIIVMLTDYVEHSKKKCKRYFPRSNGDTDGISVTVTTETTFDTHKVSVLDVTRENISRSVRHFHFLAWPDNSVPKHCGDLLLFYAKTQELLCSQTTQKSPIIVHCSAGVGRTGVFIALDYLLDRFFSERRVDVDSCLVRLRDQRMHMVQTKEQYVFLHKIVLYGMKTFHFLRNATDATVKLKPETSHIENVILREFEILEASSGLLLDESAYRAARSEVNLRKNRNPDILASESARPFLRFVSGSNGGYINAVYCNGCYANNSFIATQWPLKDTISDFWELVYDRNPSCIVILHHSPSLEEYPAFYPPQGQTLAAGQLTVTTASNCKLNSVNGAHEYDISVKQQSGSAAVQEERCSLRFLECNIFKFDKELPTDLRHIASIIFSLQLVCKQGNDRPIIVVCKDGATCCGLFLAATNSLHRLLETDKVQIFHTVDLLKASRPQFIRSIEQYRWLYLFSSFCKESLSLHANVSPAPKH